MDLIEMYPAAVNSKVTVTLGVLNADSTIIEVLDGSVLPDAPNLLVLGSDQTAETVKLTAKEGNTLTVERGIQGNAIAWPAGTQIARNFTAKDWNDLIANLKAIVEAHNVQTYTKLEQIGLTTGSETLASIANVLPLYSELIMDMNSMNNLAGISPSGKGGQFFAKKTSTGRCVFEAYMTVSSGIKKRWYGVHDGTNWTGWSEDFDSLNPPTAANVGALNKIATYFPSSSMPDIDILTDGVMLIEKSYSKNCPVTAPFIYIIQLFYDTVSATNNRIQIAVPYQHVSSGIFAVRVYHNGTWSNWNSSLSSDGSVVMTGELKYYDGSKTLAYPVPMSNAGFHNSVYRGKYLGTAVTDAQWTAIRNGTFEDLYIGDYWTIDGINYRIAAFDYYYRTGDTSCDTHHVVLVPDVIMYTHVMNDTNITDGAYVGSKMYTEGLTQAKTTITNAFGSAHILNHRQLLCNATANGYESGHAWYDSTVELMTEQNVYGCKIFGNQTNGTGWAYNYTIDKSQYPLFTFRPDMISNRQWFWLRDVASAARFARVDGAGYATADAASSATGVRPAFSIC